MVANTMSMTEKQLAIEKVSKVANPLECFEDMMKFKNGDLDVKLYCKTKADMTPKALKWAFKLAEKNVSQYYKTCSMGWQPKIKQTAMNKKWARFLVACDKDNNPVAYCMFRFDLDYERSVLYCYEMQVEETFQRKGLGAYMLSILEKACEFWQMELLVLTVLKNNPDAMKFYQVLGYTIDESSPDKSDDAAYEIMSKKV